MSEKKTRTRKPAPVTIEQVNALSLEELVKLGGLITDTIGARKEQLDKQLALIK